MFCQLCRLPMLRRLRVTVSRLLPLTIILALAACDSANEPLAPTTDSADVPAMGAATASSEAVPSGDVLALTTAQRILFMSYRNGTQPDVYKIDPQGYHLVHLASLASNESAAAWSYDNKRIALVRQRADGGTTRSDIYLINADGTSGHWARATPFPYGMTDPSWSPDGSRLVLRVWLQNTPYLGWMDLATGQVNLFNAISGGTVGVEPSYDVTGKRIVYVGVNEKTIEQINADGSGHKVRFSSATMVSYPTFSPDGTKIAFERVVGTGNDEIFVKNLADGTVKRLTTSAAYDTYPSWSPDGSRIAFASDRSGYNQIWTMNTTGGSLVRVTHTTSNESNPAWSH